MAELVFERIGNQPTVPCAALIFVDGTLRAQVGVSETVSIPVKARFTNVRAKLRKFCRAVEDTIIAIKAAPGVQYKFRIDIKDRP